ncbi:hypothetical protein ACHAXR_002013 [Thalassiosira sp. AJA248-18]
MNETNATTAEDGTFFDKLSEDVAVVLTDPREWTQQQTIGVAVGVAVAVILLLLLCYCCRRRWCGCCGDGGGPKQESYHLQRPYVTRSVASAVNSKKLPLGAILTGAEKLRQAKLDGSGVRVGVVDSGVDKDHPGFNGKIAKQKWYRAGTSLSEDDHGTHVAGTVHFMAPQAELYDYRVFGETGEDDGDEAIAKAIRQAVNDGCQIINLSLRVSYPIVPAVESAVKFASGKGVILVCAAGNSGDGDPTTNEMFAYPARWKETISVAAVKKSAGLPVAKFSESNPEVDFAGIGVDVTSLQPGGGFQTMNGTSMAAPHVTGLIAALMTNGSYKNNGKKLRKDLASKYAIDIGAKGKDNSTGVGFLTFLSKTEFNQQIQKGSSAQIY